MHSSQADHGMSQNHQSVPYEPQSYPGPNAAIQNLNTMHGAPLNTEMQQNQPPHGQVPLQYMNQPQTHLYQNAQEPQDKQNVSD